MIAERIATALTERTDHQIEFLKELVRLPSDNPPGDCAPHAELTAARLEALGLIVERHPVPEAVVAVSGLRSVMNLVVRHRFGDGPTIALNAHGDAVPPGANWTHDPYGGQIVNGRLYGRGAAVSKSDFATYAYALLALKQAAVAASGTVELHFTYDEETGGNLGPKWLLDRRISAPDMAICAGLSYAVVTAHNGCLHLEVELLGRSAHAARPETGADALEAATHVLQALYRERASYADKVSRYFDLGSPRMVIGRIEGGINTNVVPDRAVLRLDRRLIPEENGEQVERELKASIMAATERCPDIRCNVRRLLLAEPLISSASPDVLAQILSRQASKVFGEPIGTAGIPLYTDARHYAAHGIPVVLYGAGPRSFLDANAHGADEHVAIADLQRATEVIALTLAELLHAV